MESVVLDTFQDLNNLSQEKEVVYSLRKSPEKCANETHVESPMFSDAEIDNDQSLTLTNGGLSRYSDRKLSPELKEGYCQKSGHSGEKGGESCSDDEFAIKQYNSKEELQLSMGMKGNINSKETNHVDDADCDAICMGPSKPLVSWIQCDKPECQKWRKLNIDDVSTFSDQKWFCWMNSDMKYNECDLSQEEWSEDSEDESVYTSFKPGVIVLGKMAGYPWWPAIIEDDPDFDSYFYLDRKPNRENVVVSYHVTFFGKTVSRAWLLEVSVRRFNGNESAEDLGPLSHNRKSFSRQAVSALADARVALKLPLERRIERFGFLSRYKGKKLPTKDRKQYPSSKMENGRMLMGAKQAKKRSRDIVQPDIAEFAMEKHINGEDDYFENIPLPSRKKMPGKLTARQIKEGSIPSSLSENKRMKREKKVKRKERKKTKKLKKEQRLNKVKLWKEDQMMQNIDSNEIETSNQKEYNEPIVVPGAAETSDDVDDGGNVSTENASHVIDAHVMDVDVIDPSIITASQEQAESMVNKYSDPEELKKFIEGLGEMNESFSERIEKERILKEETALKRKVREDKKAAREKKMALKIKKREEKQALLKAKCEKKLMKGSCSNSIMQDCNSVKKKIERPCTGVKKTLPNFNYGIKKKSLHVKDKSSELQTLKDLDSQNIDVIKVDTKCDPEISNMVLGNKILSECDNNEKKESSDIDILDKTRPGLISVDKSDFNSPNGSMAVKKDTQSTDDEAVLRLSSDCGSNIPFEESVGDNSFPKVNTDQVCNAVFRVGVQELKYVASEKGGIKDILLDETLSRNLAVEGNHTLENKKSLQQGESISNDDRMENKVHAVEVVPNAQKSKNNSTPKSVFMSALAVEEVPNSFVDISGDSPIKHSCSDGQNEFNQPVHSVDLHKSKLSTAEIPKTATPTSDAPKVIPTFSSRKAGTKLPGKKR